MPIAESTIVIGGIALAVAGLGAYFLLGSSGASQADIDSTANAAGYKAGYPVGVADANAGKPMTVNPADDSGVIADSKKSVSPKAYLLGFAKGYSDGYASVTLKKTSTDVTGGGTGKTGGPAWKPPGPPSGLPDAMREGESAFDYGCRRGGATGKSDGDAGNSKDPETPLATDGSIARQKESGDPTQYQAGYRSCYNTAWVAASSAADMAKTLKDATSETSFGEIFIGPSPRGARVFIAMRPAYRPAFLRAG